MRLLEPNSPELFSKYYQLRWEVLRKPWNQPQGSEKDTEEENAIHVMAINESGECVGVARMQFITKTEVQIRFMGVRDDQQGKGIGKLLMNYLEEKAKSLGVKKIILQARENAVGFYLSIGYSQGEKTFKLWDIIQHYLMQKEL